MNTSPARVRQDSPGTGFAPRVLVLGSHGAAQLPSQYADYRVVHVGASPPDDKVDITCDLRKLGALPAADYDAVYCSHLLEHFYRHEVPLVLAGILHVLKPGGFAHLRVPDIHALMRATLERGLDVDAVLYRSNAGPVTVLDVLYGYAPAIARTGHEHHAHRTGFTRQSLANALKRSGFSISYSGASNLELRTIAFKGTPDPRALALFNLVTGASNTLQ